MPPRWGAASPTSRSDPKYFFPGVFAFFSPANKILVYLIYPKKNFYLAFFPFDLFIFSKIRNISFRDRRHENSTSNFALFLCFKGGGGSKVVGIDNNS